MDVNLQSTNDMRANYPPAEGRAADRGFSWKSNRVAKTAAMYCAMVAVSTVTIYWLEHSALISAFRTAMVAAVGKTIAATWVSGLFD